MKKLSYLIIFLLVDLFLGLTAYTILVHYLPNSELVLKISALGASGIMLIADKLTRYEEKTIQREMN